MTGSLFSVATTAFISLAICAIISYGVFYYFKQRLSLIEQSQMEQARIMQAIISRGLHQQHPLQQQSQQQSQQQQQQQQQLNAESVHKEITITQNSLIEVSSDEESASDSESETSDTESESGSESGSSDDKWSVGDEIHQTDAYHNEFNEMCEKRASSEKKQIHIDSIETIENIDIENIESNTEHNADDANTKKIISLNSAALNQESDDDDEDDDESTSSESEEKPQKFEVKIGYKSASSASKVNLNYGNMSVPALRQLAKERGLGGDDADLQKLKKKDLVQLLQ